jgi:hypothetical protein
MSMTMYQFTVTYTMETKEYHKATEEETNKIVDTIDNLVDKIEALVRQECPEGVQVKVTGR